MKKLLFASLLLCISFAASAQTATRPAWMDSMVPFPSGKATAAVVARYSNDPGLVAAMAGAYPAISDTGTQRNIKITQLQVIQVARMMGNLPCNLAAQHYTRLQQAVKAVLPGRPNLAKQIAVIQAENEAAQLNDITLGIQRIDQTRAQYTGQ